MGANLSDLCDSVFLNAGIRNSPDSGLLLPAHHDEFVGTFPDIGVEPLLLAVSEQVAGTRTPSPLYRDVRR